VARAPDEKIRLDVNVILDILLDRKPHGEEGAAVWMALETGVAKGMLAAHGVMTMHYLIRKEQAAAKTKPMLSMILKVVSNAAVSDLVIGQALQLPCSDFEDALTAAAAQHADCDYIVTRDPKVFVDLPFSPLGRRRHYLF
jgi:predicted nucleic acid-binding protein